MVTALVEKMFRLVTKVSDDRFIDCQNTRNYSFSGKLEYGQRLRNQNIVLLQVFRFCFENLCGRIFCR